MAFEINGTTLIRYLPDGTASVAVPEGVTAVAAEAFAGCGGVEADFRKDIGKLCPKADVREPLQVIGNGGAQLKEVTRMVEQHHIQPRIDPRVFTLETAGEALALVQKGPTDGKVLLRL